MGRFINSIQITMEDDLSDIDRIDKQLKALILSAEGTIPGSRGFGLSQDFISMNPAEAANALAIELDEKIAEYIPDVTITDLTTDPDIDGSMTVMLTVGRSE